MCKAATIDVTTVGDSMIGGATMGDSTMGDPTMGDCTIGGAPLDVAQMKAKIRSSKLHVLTFATHEQGYFKTLQESCSRLNIELTVLGMGKKWEGFITKLVKVKEYIKSCDDHDIVLFVDGFDTFFVQPANVIVERYIVNYDNLFVCTSESTYSTSFFLLRIIENMHLVFHNSIFKNNDNTEWDATRIRDKYKDFTYFYKNLNLLNSGGWISNVFLAKKILQYIPSFIENDQIFLTNLYLDCNYLMKLQQDGPPHGEKNALRNCVPQENAKYYNRIIVDNHNIIFHLFRSKGNVALMSYQDCVQFFPFRPLLSAYYLNGRGDAGDAAAEKEKKNSQNSQNGQASQTEGKNIKIGLASQTEGENKKIGLASQTARKNKKIGLASQTGEKKKKNSVLSSIVEFFRKKKSEEGEITKKEIGTNQRREFHPLGGGNTPKGTPPGKHHTDAHPATWTKQKTILDEVYMDEGQRKIGQIEKTFNYSIIDTHTHTSPCVLHMHCLRNVDEMIRTMGLKNIYSSKWYSNIWYLFYSLKGTLNFNYFSLLFSTVVAFVALLLIQVKYLLEFIKYVDASFGINCIGEDRYVNKAMLLLNDVGYSCFVSFIFAILFWAFYIFNKAMG
ncbi:procollagen lysine 5-dioxygenase, putative [Plasmodium vivax]|uniref:Procollagen lysine 5-dioxygenase, putative n=1 Tax=Plasmodium vivax TaxID=5855 RepID=A0A1G4GVP5_PLAVI|nr:procollagen lysine 5-dioxygenase, putative [Plasmodium vivax]